MAARPNPRGQLVRQYWASELKTTWPNKDKLTTAQARREYARQEKLLRDYGKKLPAVPISRCPCCASILKYVFDPLGFDGMWWAREGIVPERPPREPHHRVLLGAVDFHGRQPVEAEPNGSVLPGPGVPFVVPRLLELRGVRAVISSLALPRGDVAYLVAYFSKNKIDRRELHQNWGRESFGVRDADGDDDDNKTWGAAVDPWDFDLQPWIDRDRLQWINPGDRRLVLRRSGKCPYVGLAGTRAPQVIKAGKLGTLPLPDGEPIDPFG